jgi:hypothetical protein
MKTRMMRKIAVLVTGSALALSFPVASSFGGVPNGNDGNNGNNGKACPHKGSQGSGPKKDKTDLPSQARDKGLKCGFEKGTDGNGNGNGNHGKACPGKGNPNHPSRPAPNTHGMKCGFMKGVNSDLTAS